MPFIHTYTAYCAYRNTSKTTPVQSIHHFIRHTVNHNDNRQYPKVLKMAVRTHNQIQLFRSILLGQNATGFCSAAILSINPMAFYLRILSHISHRIFHLLVCFSHCKWNVRGHKWNNWESIRKTKAKPWNWWMVVGSCTLNLKLSICTVLRQHDINIQYVNWAVFKTYGLLRAKPWGTTTRLGTWKSG